MVNRTFDDWCKDFNKRPALAVTCSVLWVILVCGIAFFWHLGSIGLIDETEPLFAEASRQMLVRQDWITPFFNNETRFDKPALIYWFQAIAYLLMGVNEWAVRIPSAIAATTVVGLSFYTLQWYFLKQDESKHMSLPTRRWLIPSLAAAMMAFNAHMLVWGRTGVSDMLLTCCIASALLCFFLGYANQDDSKSHKGILPSKWYTAFYVLIAGAILTKGPVGIVLPGLIVLAFLLYVGKFREVLREIAIIPGLLIIFGLAAPWYLLVTWRNGWDYINSFFGYHNIERFTDVVNGHQAPWFFYFIAVLLGFAPYSVYLPSAMLNLKFWQWQNWRRKTRTEQFSLFILIWFVVIFGFFTIAVTKLPSYVLPLIPAAAILVALLWSDIITKSPTFGLRASAWINVVFVSACAAALFYVPKLIGYDPAAPNFAQALQQSNVTTIGGILWLVCAILIGFLLVNKNWVALISTNLAGFALFLLFVLTPALFIMDGERQLPLRKLSTIAVQNSQPQEELIMVGFKKPTVAFYTQRYVNYIKTSQEANNYIESKSATTTSSSVLILTEPKKLPQIGLLPIDYNILGDSGAYQLVRVPLKK
ncbi:MAG: glycosyltransferase family 39 protein [Calothrix sp. C42_A2020_038]|nr:glycosyltransferase family 39 protein [Calothrix sp. C42_A2020_038]